MLTNEYTKKRRATVPPGDFALNTRDGRDILQMTNLSRMHNVLVVSVYFLSLISKFACFHLKFHQATKEIAHSVWMCKNEQGNNIYHGKGLLTSIPDMANADFISDSLDIKEADKLLKDKHFLYNICLAHSGQDTAKLDPERGRGVARRAPSYFIFHFSLLTSFAYPLFLLYRNCSCVLYYILAVQNPQRNVIFPF